jgi:hypothetical protein
MAGSTGDLPGQAGHGVRHVRAVHVFAVYLCYMDESGDPGVHPGSPTPTYTVSCLFIHDSHWVAAFEDTLRYRRYLSNNFGLRMRTEIKANELVKGSGPWASLPFGDRVRKDIYRGLMRFQGKLGTLKTFAVVIDKSKCASPDDVRTAAWKHALERVERFTTYNHDTVMLFPDSGNYDRFRRLSRQMRRFSHVGAMIGGGTLSRPLERVLIDDPVERDSKQSYFVQLADLNAYAAYRKERPDPRFPQTMWDELGGAILVEANQNLVRRGVETPGIIRGPR